MQVSIQKTVIDESTFVPTLIMNVALDVEYISNLLENNDRDEVSLILGNIFLEKLEKVL